MDNWPHQDRGKQAIKELRLQGVKTILASAPCGAGKSRVMAQLCQEEVANGGSVKIYLHRSMLREQLSQVFNDGGIAHGVQAAGYEPEFEHPIQICMTDSVYSRAIIKGAWDLGTPSLVVFDEAHNQVEGKARAITYGSTTGTAVTYGHAQTGACVIGFSATPVGCSSFYERLVSFGSYSECRTVKAHSLVRVYSPSEIDCAGLDRSTEGEFSSKKVQERATRIIGDAYANWRKLNPDSEPAILFAPSVEGSKWFAEEWAIRGVPVAHLDGATCLLPRRTATGSIELEQYDTTPELREEIMQMSRSGEIKVLMNRFVLREAIDMPWLRHGIGATVFGGISTYLQSVGRIQRYFEGMPYKIWQCHGGSYHRHGSPNMNRRWELGDTNLSIARARVEAAKNAEPSEEVEGICCPKCNGWRTRGSRCPMCGHTHKVSIRKVMQLEGELKLMRGVVNKPKKKKKETTADALWLQTLFRSGALNQPISSAVSQWAARCISNNIQPLTNELKFKPPEVTSLDWHREVGSIFPWAKKKEKAKE